MKKRFKFVGFTLIELIIVIIIVGILAAVGLTQYTKVVEKGRAAEAKMILGTLRTAQVAYNLENGAYTTVIADLGVQAQAACSEGTHYFSYACTGGVSGGLCTAQRCGTGTGKSPGAGTTYTKTLDIAGTWGGDAGY